MDKRLIFTSLITGPLLCPAGKAEIAKNTKAVADIEDGVRRASVPPGWLR